MAAFRKALATCFLNCFSMLILFILYFKRKTAPEQQIDQKYPLLARVHQGCYTIPLILSIDLLIVAEVKWYSSVFSQSSAEITLNGHCFRVSMWVRYVLPKISRIFLSTNAPFLSNTSLELRNRYISKYSFSVVARFLLKLYSSTAVGKSNIKYLIAKTGLDTVSEPFFFNR